MAKGKKGFKRAPTNKKIVAPPKIEKLDKLQKEKFLHIEPTEVGIPGRYVKLDLKKIYRLCILGMTNQELADHYDVKYETWSQWCNSNSKTYKPALAETIQQGREDIEARVADRLVQRALGYKHKAKKIFYNSMDDKVVEHEYVQHYPPSEAAAMFILKNKRPRDWKDRQIVEGPNGSAAAQVNVTVLTDDSKIKKLLEDKERAIKNKK